MYLLSLETADPPNAYSQADCHRIFAASTARQRLRPRSVALMEKLLLRANGITHRRFAFPQVERIFDASPEHLNRVFEAEAPALGTTALQRALAAAGLLPAQIDGLIVCTCTGYLCPGLSSFIAEQAGLPQMCELTDLVGMGCGAAVPALRLADHHLRAHPQHRLAVIAVEVCSAAFYLDDDPGVIISACLFGDGAAASLWTGTPAAGSSWQTGSFSSLHLPEKRDLLRFENAGGALRNRLSRRVPAEAAKAVRALYDQEFSPDSPAPLILSHTGGRDVLDALETVFPGQAFPESRQVLLQHGNMSSPSVLYVLKAWLDSQSPPRPLWLTSFGAGFSAYSLSLLPALAPGET